MIADNILNMCGEGHALYEKVTVIQGHELVKIIQNDMFLRNKEVNNIQQL